MVKFQHDICHCNADKCTLKDTCYRYLAHLEAVEKQMDYLSYFVIKDDSRIGEECGSYWKVELNK